MRPKGMIFSDLFTLPHWEAIEENRFSKTEIATAAPLRRLSGGARTST